MAVTVAGLSAAPHASAHEIGIALVAAEGAGVDGFRLAVDQSPDVSHAPGADAGGHLGGIDVDVRVVGSSRARAVPGGARVVVVLPRAGELPAEILSRVRASEPLVVVAGDRAAPPLPVVLLRERPPARVDRARLARFERAFVRRYGRSAGRAARVGYEAGRLVDGLLARLGEGPFRDAAIAGAVSQADRALIAGTAEFVGAADPPRSGDSGSPTTVIAVVVAGAVAAGVVGLVARRRRRRAASR